MELFPLKNLKSIRIISAALSQPIAIACYSQEDEDLVTGLESIMSTNRYICADIIFWCKSKNILFSVCKMPNSSSYKLQ